jgi:hypothetical protein
MAMAIFSSNFLAILENCWILDWLGDLFNTLQFIAIPEEFLLLDFGARQFNTFFQSD